MMVSCKDVADYGLTPDTDPLSSPDQNGVANSGSDAIGVATGPPDAIEPLTHFASMALIP
jgi:hypothetical protein